MIYLEGTYVNTFSGNPHPTPYYDDSYAVDSPNNGPYGQVVMTELIPYIESHFRAIPQPWARILSGGSTGGWEALALQSGPATGFSPSTRAR